MILVGSYLLNLLHQQFPIKPTHNAMEDVKGQAPSALFGRRVPETGHHQSMEAQINLHCLEKESTSDLIAAPNPDG